MNNLNQNIKVFFIDLDGTLLDIKNKYSLDISNENKESMKKVISQGKHIVVSTGRSGYQAKKYLDKIECEYAVTGNGSIILQNNKIIKSIKIGLKKSLLLIDFAKKNKLVMKFDDSIIGYGSFGKVQSYITKKMNFKPVKNFNVDMHKQYHKIVLWGKTKRKMKKIGIELSKTINGISIVSSSHGYTLEISDEKATKGLGNLFVANKMGFNKDQIMHIGDSMNDSTTIPFMRLVAMKNSAKELKLMAKFHGPHFKKSGVAKILNGDYEHNKKS